MVAACKYALPRLILAIALFALATGCNFENRQEVAPSTQPVQTGNAPAGSQGATVATNNPADPVKVPATVAAVLTRTAPTPAPTPNVAATVAAELTRIAPPTPASGRPMSTPGASISDLVEDIKGGLVQILTPDASGSGFAVSDDGLIVTNAHLVQDHHFVTVRSVNGRSYAGVVRGKDENVDLAVVKIQSLGNITAMPLGNVSEIRPGDPVFAMGFPLREQLGDGYTITTGIVSSVRNFGSVNRIQTDAAINVGSSGGPLVNGAGEVIGVNVATFQDHVGISLAISVQEVKDSLTALSAGLNAPAHARVEFQNYHNEECRYVLRIPAGWENTGGDSGCQISWGKFEGGAQVGAIQVWDYPLQEGETLAEFAEWWLEAMEERASGWHDFTRIYSREATVERDGIQQEQYVIQYNWQEAESNCHAFATDTIVLDNVPDRALIFSTSVCEFVSAPVFHAVDNSTISVGGPTPVRQWNSSQ